mmetsp:Transcript_42895/g.115472  ORF Transcript_42895/g.115472 Transcript_42895/m.115472 type:complete len:102 (-) Transcript_42895:55-360(-)
MRRAARNVAGGWRGAAAAVLAEGRTGGSELKYRVDVPGWFWWDDPKRAEAAVGAELGPPPARRCLGGGPPMAALDEAISADGAAQLLAMAAVFRTSSVTFG